MNAEATPAALGYRWPAEWESHAATWVAWPHNRETWPDRFDRVPAPFAELVRTLAGYEPVHVLAGDGETLEHARQSLKGIPGVTLHSIPTDDAWCRDHGPIFLSGSPGSPPALIDFEYNAWGRKYPRYQLDNAVPSRIADLLGFRRFAAGVVLEAGAIDGNGQGTVLASATCLLHPNRNPNLDRPAMERVLGDYLGASKVLWLERGHLAGDDTDGHVDQLARFVAPTTVLAAWETDPQDENYEPLRQNFFDLRQMSDQSGRHLDVIPLLLPHPQTVEHRRLPASYCNFYIANDAVVVPQFEDPRDELALRTLASVFPDRKVIGLPALDLVWGLGAFHCLTQQQCVASAR